jgi:hypothetical protein
VTGGRPRAYDEGIEVGCIDPDDGQGHRDGHGLDGQHRIPVGEVAVRVPPVAGIPGGDDLAGGVRTRRRGNFNVCLGRRVHPTHQAPM